MLPLPAGESCVPIFERAAAAVSKNQGKRPSQSRKDSQNFSGGNTIIEDRQSRGDFMAHDCSQRKWCLLVIARFVVGFIAKH